MAYILLDLGMDTDTICAGMLHDVVEDTPHSLDEIRKLFGQDVAMLVDGVTKLSKAPIFNQDEQLAENVRKILLAMSQDIRPLQILMLNLMPVKIDTETQFARVLGNTPLQIDLDLIAPAGHTSKNTTMGIQVLTSTSVKK